MTKIATEAKELLLGCLRFRNGQPDGFSPYDDDIDDRDPVGFVPPPDLPHSGGWNQVWNTIVSLDQADLACEGAVRALDEAVAHLRAVINCANHVELIAGLVAATRWLDAYDAEPADA